MTRRLVALLVLLAALVLGVWSWRQASLRGGGGPRLEALGEPAAVMVDAELLEETLARAPWVSPSLDGPALWVVGYRACEGCERFLQSQLDDLVDDGVDVRVVFFAPEDEAPPEELAVLAELGVRRNWDVLRAWLAGPPSRYYARTPMPPAADPVRQAVVAAGRRTRDEVEAVMAENGYEAVYPLLFWRQGDDLMVAEGDTVRARRAVRAALAD